MSEIKPCPNPKCKSERVACACADVNDIARVCCYACGYKGPTGKGASMQARIDDAIEQHNLISELSEPLTVTPSPLRELVERMTLTEAEKRYQHQRMNVPQGYMDGWNDCLSTLSAGGVPEKSKPE